MQVFTTQFRTSRGSLTNTAFLPSTRPMAGGGAMLSAMSVVLTYTSLHTRAEILNNTSCRKV